MSQRQHNFRAEAALMAAVRAEAERQGMNASEFIREALMFRLGYLAKAEHAMETGEIEAMLRRISERG